MQIPDEINKLLTPSWLSGLIAVTVGVVLVAGAAAAMHYRGSDIQFLRQLQAAQPTTVTAGTSSVNDSLESNEFISNIPLFVFWGGVGLIAYSLVMQLVKAFTSAVDLRNELEYVHVDRRQLLRRELERFAIRLAAFIIWIIYLQLTIHWLVPYIIALAYAASGSLGLLTDAIYLAGGVCIMALAVHLHVILLRVVLLRPRITHQPL